MRDKPGEGLVLLTLNIAIMLWGFSGVFGKWVEVDAFNLTFWRMFIALIPLLLLYFIRNKGTFEFNISLCIKNFISAILLAGHWISFFIVIKLSTIGLGIIFSTAFVFIVAFTEPLIFRSNYNFKTLLASLIGGGGLIVALFSNIFEATLEVWIYGLATAICLAALSLFNRKYLIKEDTLNCMTAQFLYGSLILLPLGFIGITDFFSLSADSIGKLLILGILTTAIGHTIYFWSLRHITATKASMLTLLEPVYGILFGLLFFSEIPDTPMVIGSTIVILCACSVAFTSSITQDHLNATKENNTPNSNDNTTG